MNQGRVHYLVFLLERRLKMNSIDLPDNIKTCIVEYLQIISAEFRFFFNNDTLRVLWYSRRSRGVGRVQSFECDKIGI